MEGILIFCYYMRILTVQFHFKNISIWNAFRGSYASKLWPVLPLHTKARYSVCQSFIKIKYFQPFGPIHNFRLELCYSIGSCWISNFFVVFLHFQLTSCLCSSRLAMAGRRFGFLTGLIGSG